MPTRRRESFDRRLARPLVLADRRRLITLKHASDVLLDVFGSVNAKSHALDHAIALLMQAATIGARYDVEAAAIERVLRDRRLL